MSPYSNLLRFVLWKLWNIYFFQNEMECLKEQPLFETGIFCGINVFIFTFDEINASFLAESIHFFSKEKNIFLTSKF